MFPEERIFRIDHYLGKESVEDLLVFRFSNTLLEPIWNRNYVRSVQITMSETIGVEGRGSFYDGVGAIRDVMQNHLLQVVALVAMEPPVGPESQLPAGREGEGVRGDAARSTRRARARPVRRLPRRARRRTGLDGRDVRRGAPRDRVVAVGGRAVVRALRQGAGEVGHRGGRRVPGAAEHAVRRGRRADARTATWSGSGSATNDGVTFTLQAKTPGPHLDSQDVDIAVDFAAALGERREAYERLLDDALDGSPRRFAREDIVEQTWRVVQPALDEPGEIHPYFRGSWGPSEADARPRRRPLVRPLLTAAATPSAPRASPVDHWAQSIPVPRRDCAPVTKCAQKRRQRSVPVRRGMTTTVPSGSWCTATLTP